MLLPEPGGPMKRRLCPPAAAISSAIRACSSPRTSTRSSGVDGRSWDSPSPVDGAGSVEAPVKNAITSASVAASTTFAPPTSAASAALTGGKIEGDAPQPSPHGSSRAAARRRLAARRTVERQLTEQLADIVERRRPAPHPAPRGWPMAIGRSNGRALRLPCRSAGARLTVSLRAGSFQPPCANAARTRTAHSTAARAPSPTK